MIEIPSGKFYGEMKPNDPNAQKLADFLSDPANKSLKKSFEDAAGVKLERRGSRLYFFADQRENVPAIAEALSELGREVKLTVEKKKFDGVLKKFG